MLTVLVIGTAVPTEAPSVIVCDEKCIVPAPTSWLGPKPSDSVPPGQICQLLLFCSGIAYPSPPFTAIAFPPPLSKLAIPTDPPAYTPWRCPTVAPPPNDVACPSSRMQPPSWSR